MQLNDFFICLFSSLWFCSVLKILKWFTGFACKILEDNMLKCFREMLMHANLSVYLFVAAVRVKRFWFVTNKYSPFNLRHGNWANLQKHVI